MDYKVEEISPVKRKIIVEVKAEEANAAIATTVALYRARTDIKGFRKGKVPGSVVESKYRKQIYGEATTDLINVHINQIVGEEGMQPLSRIDVDAKELEKDSDFTYSLEFEVAPKFDLPKYKELKIEEVKPEVSEEEIQEVEKRILDNQAEVKTVAEDRKPVDGDVATVSFGAYQNDELVQGIKAENFDLQIGSYQALPEFEELIKTLMPGEAGEADVTFPADFINNELAGQTVTFKAKVHAVKERIIPEMSDEIAKKAGFEDMETMRKGIRESYMSQRKQLNKSDAQSKLIKSIVDGLDFPLPPSLLEDRVERLVRDLEYKMDRQGKSLAATGKTLEQIREEFRPEAEEAVRTEIFLLAVAAEEGLDVSREELDGTMAQMAMQTRQPLHEIKKYYEDNNLIAPLKDRLLADKAMEFIYDNAEVTEIEPVAEKAEKKAPAKKAPAKKTAAKKADGEKKTAAKKPAAKKAPAKKAAAKKDEGEKKPAARKTTKKAAKKDEEA
ncbi:trigger factor [Pseudodesulfovibrio tunisiensis]|uniref:trigger factor n=1 Tax=Pseudodesulfovibrio tunisiensis TaxID=463192 RepID=UPI001FB386D1|nr:trigger factor [Pseudodesulfovibrio tunisiensis]